MNPSSLRVALSSALLCTATLAHSTTDTLQLPTQTILGASDESRDLSLPLARSTLFADDLSSANLGANLSEPLQRVPGLLALNRQNYAQDVQVSSRGFGARAQFGVRGVRLVQDGIPLTMPDGQGQPAQFDLDNLERIEVLRGPLSALYGNASGGIIQGFSSEGSAYPTLDSRGSIGSDGLWRERLKYGAQHGDLNVAANLSRLETDGYRDHSETRRDMANLRLGWDIDDVSSLTLVVNALDQPETQDPLGLTAAALEADRQQAVAQAERFDTRKSVSHQQLGMNYQRRLASDDQITVMAYGGERDVQQFLAFPGNALYSGGGVIELDRRFGGSELGWQRDTTLFELPVTLAAGLSWNYQGEGRKGFVNQFGHKGGLQRDEFNRVESREAYLISTWQLAPRWHLTAGARYSKVKFDSDDNYFVDGQDDSGSVRYDETTPALGLSYQWTPDVSLYGAIGKGFETPTAQELAYRPSGSGLNFELRPSKADNAEVGLKLRRERTQLDLALFYTETDNEIVTGASQVNSGRTTYANAGQSTRQGIELSVQQQLAPSLTGYLAYTWLDARFDSYTNSNGDDLAGNRLPGVPRHSLYAELAWQPTASFSTALEMQSLSQRYANDDNSAEAPGYAAFNWRASYRQQLGSLQLEPFARIDNLTDKEYIGSLIVNGAGARYYEPAPERSWLIGLGLQYRWQ
ncbi:TonB-dependent receptor family protein [Halopseudomonas maritima]|uniref:TonB-dependent receptor family protein n=1 Tax=Halopseudomonas maritima TaxID=2918528 RepID=UPI001EEA0C09|nr:TonB-dependent receptor [Halopseudomonas maritima]UJJ30165.1 TonB-dependent receptor [Halopseudomonas maritima]